ncbi:PfkB family carbohydrate kinase [Aestuariivirga sp. YIM B02566]|uniref:Fructoselysine 6-kinase n=1 Tax=Taklimakanibacter albus TaxID=2800327 RepID=A0ACC5RD42_9HYPH|nr:PfkB family carbohydrate kinase [Aestuariivirga sp. YIM B02566]MBK1870614.1 fructoselysine 6-kinase [Aestuariivirga sp. YIM B02566]
MAGLEIAAVGDNCIDRFTGAERFSLVGGNAVNVAVQLCRLGRKAAYFGAVGTDAAGTRTVRILSQNGVDVDHVRTVPGITAYTEVARNEEGDRKFVHEEFGVVEDYRTDARDLAILKSARHVHIGWLNDDGALRMALAGAGISVSQDTSVNAEARNLGVAGLAIAFATSDGPSAEAAARARELIAAGARLVVITRGSRGSLASDGDTVVELPALPIDPVDTTGAGDAFIAGFLDARLKALPLLQCLEQGREIATRTCLHLGGFPQELHRDP